MLVVNVDKPLLTKVSLVSMLGQQLISREINLGYVGSHNLGFNVGHLQAGIYFIRVEAGKDTLTRKVVVH